MPWRFASCAGESDDPSRAGAAQEELFGFAALWRAYLACRRGKRRSASAQRHAQQVFDHLLGTAQALQSRQWRPSAATCFIVTRPKAREILAAPFGDRVVHHLLVPRLERCFEPVFIFDAWSNRRGKGVHGAAQRLRGFMQAQTGNGARPGFALQLDIANFFNRIDRARLYALTERRLRADSVLLRLTRAGEGAVSPSPAGGGKGWGPPRRRWKRDCLHPNHPPAGEGGNSRRLSPDQADHLLWLTRRLLTGNAAQGARLQGDAARFARLPAHKRLVNAPAGVGLPIGNLTSQFFANVYLNELDQFVKHDLKCRHYLRYVDDFVLLAPDVQTLECWRARIAQFLHDKLGLALRDAGRIVPVADGVDFLGYRVRATHLVSRPRVQGHARQALHDWQARWLRQVGGAWVLDLPEAARQPLAARVASYAAHWRHARHERLWQRLRTRFVCLRALFAPPDAAGACAPLWQPPPTLARLPEQWRWFAAQGPHWFADAAVVTGRKPFAPAGAPAGRRVGDLSPTRAAASRFVGDKSPTPLWLLLQVGNALETHGPHARRLAAAWPGHGGQPVWRRGLGWGLAWPLGQRTCLFAAARRLGWAVAWVAEEGHLRHGGKRRVLRQLRWPAAPPGQAAHPLSIDFDA